MGYYIENKQMDQILTRLQESHDIYAPKTFRGQGFGQRTNVVRYGEIHTITDIVYDIKSDFSPKEIFYPIVQPLLFFQDGECIESHLKSEKDILIFARSCDIHGIQRLDKIFLENGGHADNYYQRYRNKVKFVLMECGKGWDSCFCVSMGTNQTADYSIAVRFTEDGLMLEVKDEAFIPFFGDEPKNNYQLEFVECNQKKVDIPDIRERRQISDIINLDYWKQYNDQCLSCGSCNTVCISCSCFDTVDVIYNETSMDGERRRVWSSCMLKDFSVMAGGHGVRSTAGERLRFKTLHKICDFKQRFQTPYHMCVGCGRCDMRCPQGISFSDAINGLSREVEQRGAKAMKREVPENE